MYNTVLSFLSVLVRKMLAEKCPYLWEEMWEQTFQLINEAEGRWEQPRQGAEKKRWVMQQVTEYIEAQVTLNCLQRQILKFFLTRIINAVVATLNEELGRNWKSRMHCPTWGGRNFFSTLVAQARQLFD